MILLFDPINKNWELKTKTIDPYSDYFDFYFSVNFENLNNIIFKNLSFGCSISGDKISYVASFPEKGISYIATDQEYLESFRVFGFRPNRTYEINAWAENDNNYFSKKLFFSIPTPEQPFSSWSWNDELAEWVPPFSPPDQENFYEWNEEKEDWDLVIID